MRGRTDLADARVCNTFGNYPSVGIAPYASEDESSNAYTIEEPIDDYQKPVDVSCS